MPAALQKHSCWGKSHIYVRYLGVLTSCKPQKTFCLFVFKLGSYWPSLAIISLFY